MTVRHSAEPIAKTRNEKENKTATKKKEVS